MTTPRDIPLTPRDSSDDPTLSPSHTTAAILTMDEPDEHDHLLSTSPDNDYGDSSEIENLLGDHNSSVILGTVGYFSFFFFNIYGAINFPPLFYYMY